jgi:hypothetical protein
MRFLSKTAAGGVVAAVAISLASVATSSAAGTRAVRCVGTGDYCAATVSIAHGAVNRRVTVNLTDTDVKLAKVTVRPPASKGAFEISRASYRLGGSQYRFTLNAVRGNPRGARIVLIFAAGASVGRTAPGGPRGVQSATAEFSVGAGMKVSIVGGGGGTSLCTNDETNTSFTTTGKDDRRSFGFDAKNSGSCYFDLSWSQFKVRVEDSSGKLIGAGTMFLGQQYVFGDYAVSCDYGAWAGVSCSKGQGQTLKITRP